MLKGLSRLSRCSGRVSRAPRVLILLALCGLAGSAFGGSAAATPTPVPASFTRVCADPPPGELACFALRRTTGVMPTIPAGVSPAATVGGYGPTDLASAYKLPTNLGSGKTVAIVDAYNNPNAESDLATYRSQFGLPACTTANGCFRKVNQNGAASPLPASNSGWSSEIALDIEMVSAVCPQCHILLVEANSPTTANLGTAVNTAVAQGAVAVSNSYGGAESSSDPSTGTTYYKHPGVAITVSSGDGGYGVEFPASSPWVTAVGGTSLSTASNARGWTETARGPSPTARRRRQRLLASRRSRRSRRIPAARGELSPTCPQSPTRTPGGVYDMPAPGGWTVFGGTSVSSPIIASVYALASPPRPVTSNSTRTRTGAPLRRDERRQRLVRAAPTCARRHRIRRGRRASDRRTASRRVRACRDTNDFSVAVSPTSATVAPGSNATATVSTAVSRPAAPNRCR
jgi:hypothetical protein